MTIHATALLIGRHAVLLRGASGSGKSGLALALLHEKGLPFTRLISDDRVKLRASHGRLIVEAHPAIAGLIELRGLGPMPVPFAAKGVVALDVLLTDAVTDRLPELKTTDHCHVPVPHYMMGRNIDSAAVIVAFLQTLDKS